MTSEKELCECGCGRAADNTISTMSSHELAGARYRLACADGKMFERIRARRASGEQQGVAARKIGPIMLGGVPLPGVCEVRNGPPGMVSRDGGRTYSEDSSDAFSYMLPFLKECEEAMKAVLLPFSIMISIVSPTCRACSSPATHSGYCVYCFRRTGYEGCTRVAGAEELAARRRNAAALAAERPPETKQSREAAKAHPWEAWSTPGSES